MSLLKPFSRSCNLPGTASALVALLLLLASSAVDAQKTPKAGGGNPVDKLQKQLARQVSKAGRSAQGAIPLLTLWRNWDLASAPETFRLLQKLAKDGRLSQQRRALVQALLAQARVRTGDLSAIESDFDRLGYIRQWRVIGPFDNEGKRGFDAETPPEQGAADPPDLEASYPGRERPVRWRNLPDVVRYGYLSLDSVFRPYQKVCALAESYLYSDRARALNLWLGAGGAVKVYWNGEQVFSDEKYRQPAPDRSAVVVGAYKGYNRLLAKVCVDNSSWGLFMRVSDERGGPAKGVRTDLSTPPPTSFEKGQGLSRLPKPPLTTLDALEQAVQKQPKDAAALENLARYLEYTGADDPTERRARQLAALAAETEPTVARLGLAADLSEQRGEKMRFADRARQLWPHDSESALLRASLIAQGSVPEEALPLLDTIPEGDLYRMRAVRTRVTILHDLELLESAYAEMVRASQKVPETAASLRALALLASASGRGDQSVEALRRLIRIRGDDLDTRRLLIADALERGDNSEVLRQMDALRLLVPGSVSNLLYQAAIHDALGRDDLALACYREAIELVPGDFSSRVAYGRALLKADNREGAAEAFREALRIKPQDAATRELLEQVQRQKPQARRDEAYAVTVEELLKKQRPRSGYPSEILQDLTVKTVFDNGLGSNFRQMVVRVHDAEGARNWRTYSIVFDPDSQRVEVRLARVHRKSGKVLEAVQSYEQQLGQPWYRLYYDTRAEVVVFPDLEPGDVVELRYRVDDVAHRNLFADYFGDLTVIQDLIPKVSFRYVLIGSRSRTFFFNQPELAGLRRNEQVLGELRIHSFEASDVPAIHAEADMPGMTEVSPYIHVSTYRDWQQVGAWYWGLIKDQLYADESLKRTVSELLRGATDTRDKVQRIHNWVLRNTRYVGLEFGIHGYLPYRVPQVVERGFGDCKDKAAVMVTMMREAGIEARMVLVRTRSNGRLSESPASLAVFDHVIVYVPELDLYLDGTAEHNGSRELPVEDQGVMVLLTGAGGAELRQTPVFEPERNRRTLSLRVKLAADGSAQLSGKEEVSGDSAAVYRDTFQAPGTRGERFERSLASTYPGAKLLSQSFESLDDLEQPVSFRYRAAVPQMARWDGDELRLPPSVLTDLIRSLALSPSRHYPLDLRGTRLYLESRSIQLPPGLRASEPPAGGEAVSEFGRLKLSFEYGDREVVSNTRFEVLLDRITPAQYPAFRQWVEQADQLLRQSMGFKKR